MGVHAKHGVAIEVAGIPIRLKSDAPDFLHLVATRTAWLTAAEDARPVVTIDYTLVPGAHEWPREGEAPLSIERSGTETRIAGDGFVAVVDLETGRVCATGPLSLFLIDLVIRVILPELFDDALLLHCCVLGHDTGAWVCSGPSGAGKSTLLSLLPDLAVCDELAILHRRRNTPSVRPLWAEGRTSGSLEVERIFLIEHGDRHCRRAVGPSEGFRRLSRETNWPVTGSEATRRTFKVLSWLIDHTPIWNLRFTPDPGVRELIGR